MSRPMPLPTPVSQPYWDGLSRHEVWIQYSPSLGEYVYYPRILAPGTLADDLEWRQISGAGTLVSFAVARRPVAPQFAADVPQILGVVEWDEGPRFATELVDIDESALRVGMPVAPVFTDYPDDGVTLLRYTAKR
ncbi:Zn-ribbon domain-containing OB-fold protein [Mycobacterium sp. 94-17]|uniref:Zn-ribbon domain-containing OB-fold protein n=1 Tax=Mycobacterium sp. 94-17 TaxID=2986147 RepID=UPI002D1ED231|nr:OB-fold domain-containing protein [Mycobacterium sp. 94-17]MEB4209734.1 OB-fold domain-containing protein [Mycobacterium sp. 94-17]